MISSLHRASSAVPLSEPPCWRAGDIDITKLRTEDEPDSNSEHYPRQAKPMILNLENLMHSTPEVIELELERMDMSELEKLDLSLEQGTSR
ncbi:hypothetical protein BSKO_01692 [Bryopsis sp. KO-2023]|nr:hypothetical protein BSKO_01692 [Bryopsis sp. KO-2023]